MSYNPGDRIKYRQHYATILTVEPKSLRRDNIEIEFEQKGLIPPKMHVPEELIVPIKSNKIEANYSQCNCGAKHTSHKNIHSDWCRLYSNSDEELDDMLNRWFNI